MALLISRSAHLPQWRKVAGGAGLYNRRAGSSACVFRIIPTRAAINGVFELPFMREKSGVASKSSAAGKRAGFLTLQSGTPFTALMALTQAFGLSQLNATPRVHLNTGLDLASLSVQEIYRAGGANLFSRVTASNPLGNTGRNILRFRRDRQPGPGAHQEHADH
mgnify:CR=1 FL=1